VKTRVAQAGRVHTVIANGGQEFRVTDVVLGLDLPSMPRPVLLFEWLVLLLLKLMLVSQVQRVPVLAWNAM
jgi:hypothetical protein